MSKCKPDLIAEDQERFRQLRDLLVVMLRHDPSSPVGVLLKNHLGEAAASMPEWLNQNRRHPAADVVLAFNMPGYVTVGQGDDIRTVEDPNLDGLVIAQEVFLYGLSAPAVLRTRDFNKSPNAAGGALRRAAEWAEPHCMALANAIRAISVGNDGRMTYRGTQRVNVVSAWV